MVWQNHVGAVADEEIAVNVYARVAQLLYFLEEGNGIQNHSVSDDGLTAGPQYAARDQLQDKTLLVNGHRMTGVVAARVSGYDGEIVREYVDNLAFAFVTPLRAYHYCRVQPGQNAFPSNGTLSPLKVPGKIRKLIRGTPFRILPCPVKKRQSNLRK
jgi:hypothetical protein